MSWKRAKLHWNRSHLFCYKHNVYVHESMLFNITRRTTSTFVSKNPSELILSLYFRLAYSSAATISVEKSSKIKVSIVVCGRRPKTYELLELLFLFLLGLAWKSSCDFDLGGHNYLHTFWILEKIEVLWQNESFKYNQNIVLNS